MAKDIASFHNALLCVTNTVDVGGAILKYFKSVLFIENSLNNYKRIMFDYMLIIGDLNSIYEFIIISLLRLRINAEIKHVFNHLLTKAVLL